MPLAALISAASVPDASLISDVLEAVVSEAESEVARTTLHGRV